MRGCKQCKLALAAARSAHHTAETMLARVKQELVVQTSRADAAEKALLEMSKGDTDRTP